MRSSQNILNGYDRVLNFQLLKIFICYTILLISFNFRCRQSPVSVAASEGQVGVLELLLTRQANIEAADPDGLTPVAFAVIRGITILKKIVASMLCILRFHKIFCSTSCQTRALILKKLSICSIHVIYFEISQDFCPFQAKFARRFEKLVNKSCEFAASMLCIL